MEKSCIFAKDTEMFQTDKQTLINNLKERFYIYA